MKKNIIFLVGILGMFATNIAKAEAKNPKYFEINFNYFRIYSLKQNSLQQN